MKDTFRINIFTSYSFTVLSNIQSINQISMNDDVFFTFIRFISQYYINDYFDPGTFTRLLSLFIFYISIDAFGYYHPQ